MKNVIYVLVFLMGINVFGQFDGMTVKKSDREVLGNSYGIVGSSDNATYLLEKKGRGGGIGMAGNGRYLLMLEKYDKELNFIDEIEIQDVFLPFSNFSPKKIFEFSLQNKEGNLFLFYSENKEGHTNLYGIKLDEETFQFEEPVLFSKVKLHDIQMDRRFTFNLVESEDKSHFAIYSIAPYNENGTVGRRKKGKPTYIYIEVFDSELNSKWNREEIVTTYKFETSKKYYDLLNTRIELKDSGLARYDGIISCLSNNGSFNMLDRVANGSYFLYSFNPTNSDLVIKEIKHKKENSIDNAKMHYDNENNLRIVFLYENENIEGARGIYIEIFDPINLNEINRYITEIDSNNVKKFMGWDTEEFNEKKEDFYSSLLNYTILEMYKHSNNGITIVLSKISYPKPRPRFGLEFSKSNLVFINISEIGEIKWLSYYAKNQDSRINQYFLSIVKCTNDNIYFLYNNSEEHTIQICKLDFKNNRIESKLLLEKIRLDRYPLMSTLHSFDEQIYILLPTYGIDMTILKFVFE